MKKAIFLLSALSLAVLGYAATDDDRPVHVDQLPAEARQLLSTYFNNEQVVLATLDNDWFGGTYEVRLSDGSEIHFTKEGVWCEIDTAPRPVPAGLIPAELQQQVERQFAGQQIVQIDRDRRDYEVKLSNGLELKYNLKFQLVEMDD